MAYTVPQSMDAPYRQSGVKGAKESLVPYTKLMPDYIRKTKAPNFSSTMTTTNAIDDFTQANQAYETIKSKRKLLCALIMVSLRFSMLPDYIVQFNGLLNCLAKFSESVSIEATKDGLRLSTLNSTKSAHVSVKINSHPFFSHYLFAPGAASEGNHGFSCQMYIKALLSVFKGRVNDARDKDNVIERCEVRLQDNPDESRCRLIIQMLCKHGVVKTYKLTYEAIDVQHAVFDPRRASNQWWIEAQLLREIIEHFGSSAEQLDIFCTGDRAVFTSFTTKITDGKEILRQPVHTSVAIDTHDFNYLNVQSDLHLTISAKDFKAIVSHAYACKVPIVSEYSHPGKPMRLSYDIDDGSVLCEFTLMTRDAGVEANEGNASRVTEDDAQTQAERIETKKPKSVTVTPQDKFLRQQQKAERTRQTMSPENPPAAPTPPPPSIPAPFANYERPPPLPLSRADQPMQPAASLLQDQSLFVPADDNNDSLFDETHLEEEEEDILRWDATGMRGENENASKLGARRDQDEDGETSETLQIPPTQNMSQIRGLFD